MISSYVTTKCVCWIWVGFRPQLFQCTNCAAEIQAQDQYFSAQLGGVFCPRCGPLYEVQAGGVQPITMAALKYLRHFQRSNFSEAAAAPIFRLK